MIPLCSYANQGIPVGYIDKTNKRRKWKRKLTKLLGLNLITHELRMCFK